MVGGGWSAVVGGGGGVVWYMGRTASGDIKVIIWFIPITTLCAVLAPTDAIPFHQEEKVRRNLAGHLNKLTWQAAQASKFGRDFSK